MHALLVGSDTRAHVCVFVCVCAHARACMLCQWLGQVRVFCGRAQIKACACFVGDKGAARPFVLLGYRGVRALLVGSGA